MINFDNWTKAIADAPAGVQRVFKSVLELAAEEKKVLVYGRDFGGGNSTCLVNAAGSMLSATGGKSGHGIPSKYFNAIVRQFDIVNADLFRDGVVNTERGTVSPLAAEILLQHYPDLKPMSSSQAEIKDFGNGLPYVEVSDEDIAQDLAKMFMSDPPKDVTFSEDLEYGNATDR